MSAHRWLQAIFWLSFSGWIFCGILMIIRRPVSQDSGEFIGMFICLIVWNLCRIKINNIKRSMIVEEIIRDLKNV